MAVSRDVLALTGYDNTWRWNVGSPLGTPVVVTYAFSTKKPGYDTEKRSGFSAFSEAHKKHARTALDMWAESSGLTFVEVPQTKGGQIRFAMENMVGRNAAGFAYFPSVDYEYDEPARKWKPLPGFKGDDIGGDVFLLASDYRNDPAAIAPGPWSWLLVHEIGHALGFKHPHDGKPLLRPAIDNVANTVLSYNYDPGFTGGIGWLDKKAAQYYYGNKSFNVKFNKKTLKVDITSTNKGEHLLGTELADTLRALGGNDTVRAGPGNDKVLAGNGNDRVYGGEGKDLLYGGAGNDRLYGDEGSDKLYGDAGNDMLYGGEGKDFLYGGAGNDRLYGGEGNDVLRGGAGIDRLYGDEGRDALHGDAGNDFLYGGDGNDRLFGGAGNDRFYGGEGVDLLYGGAGNDRIYGDEGRDRLYGGAGNDRLYGGEGNDWLYGGPGKDYAYFSGRQADYAISASGSTIVVKHMEGFREDGVDRLVSVEYLVFSDGVIAI